MPDRGAYAQADLKVQSIEAKSVSETGCPVGLDAAEAELEMDPFNSPVAIRIFITYRNNSNQQLVAVKFRVRFLDDTGETRGNFQADDQRPLASGTTISQKWRKEGIDPRTRRVLTRVLKVKFADGTTWTSEKFQEQADTTTGSSAPPPPHMPSAQSTNNDQK